MNNNFVPVIKEHNFQEAKSSIKKSLEQISRTVSISTVSTQGGMFNLFSHKVTGEEFNKLVSELKSFVIHNNQIHSNIFGDLQQVYKALEALDKDYISSIVASFKTAEVISNREREDRENISKVVKVLEKFKKEIENLKHFMDIDKVWDNLEEQIIISEKLKNNVNNLLEDIKNLTIKLKDIDNKYNVFENNIKREQEECLNKVNSKLEDIDNKYNVFENNIKREQEEYLNKVNSKLEEDDIFIRDFVIKTNKKVKIFCLISGISIAISVVQLLLNIFKIL